MVSYSMPVVYDVPFHISKQNRNRHMYVYMYGSFSFVAVHSYLRPVKAHKFCIFGLWLVVGGLVVGGWWLVVVVGGGDDLGSGIRYLRPPTIRMRVKWHLQSYVRRWHTKEHDFLTLRVRGLGPADPKGRKIFWGVCMLSP